jgi:hypothetical protein
MERLSDQVIAIGQELMADLYRESPLYRALRDGTVSRSAYTAWLVQTHKYIRWTNELLEGYARAMASHAASKSRSIRVSADRHAQEEHTHDRRVLEDIARLWRCSPEEALVRIDAEPRAPAVHLYDVVTHTTVERFPAAFSGHTQVFEVLGGTISSAAWESFHQRIPFEGCLDVIGIFDDHKEDAIHVSGGRMRVDLVEDPGERAAILMVARLAKDMYRGIIAWLDARLGADVTVSDLAMA